MLELLNKKGYESISKPSPDFLKVLDIVLASKRSPTIAEIGVGIGATTVEILKKVKSGELHIYDYLDRVNNLASDLENYDLGFDSQLKIVKKGNGRETYNSYAWALARDYLHEKGSSKKIKKYDLIYFDGAHAFHHDAPACVVIKEKVRKNGYIVFDDMYWTFNSSPVMNPTSNPNIKKDYSEEQLDTPHIEMVVKMFMETDKRFQQIYLTDNKKPYRSVFKRIK